MNKSNKCCVNHGSIFSHFRETILVADRCISTFRGIKEIRSLRNLSADLLTHIDEELWN